MKQNCFNTNFTFKKDHTFFSNSDWEVSIFFWQYLTKPCDCMTCWSWSDRLRNSFSVTTWLMNTCCCCCCCCSAPCWDCVLTFSKVTSLPPNYKRTNKQSQFEHKDVAKKCFYYTHAKRNDCDLNIYPLGKISEHTLPYSTIWP